MWAFGVEPDDPLSGCQLDLVDVAPRALPADEFVLEDPTVVSASALSSASPTDPTEGSTPSSMSRWVKATDVYWAARVAVRNQPAQAGGAVLGASEERRARSRREPGWWSWI